MPERIQMRRDRPWRADNPDAVKVDRSTKWGNPFVVGDLGAAHAVHAFAAMVSDADARSLAGYPEPEQIRAELGGHDLACWCPIPAPGEPDRCHAAVLIWIANPALCPECRDGKHRNCPEHGAAE